VVVVVVVVVGGWVGGGYMKRGGFTRGSKLTRLASGMYAKYSLIPCLSHVCLFLRKPPH